MAKSLEKQFKFGFMPMGSYLKPAFGSFEKICESLKGMGYDSVEWPTAVLNPLEKSVEEIKNVVEISNSFGLTVSELVVQQDFVSLDEGERQAAVDYVIKSIKKYRAAGIDTINLFTGPRPWLERPLLVGKDLTEGRAWDMVFQAFDKILPVAEKHEMNLAVEGVWGMLAHDFYTAKSLIDHYNSPYLGVNFDPSHDILAGNFDIGWIIKQWGKDRIKHVHLKDAVGVVEGSNFVFPLLGEGKVSWNDFFQSFAEIGYEGTMSVEFESFDYLENILGGDMEKAAGISMDHIQILVDNWEKYSSK